MPVISTIDSLEFESVVEAMASAMDLRRGGRTRDPRRGQVRRYRALNVLTGIMHPASRADSDGGASSPALLAND